MGGCGILTKRANYFEVITMANIQIDLTKTVKKMKPMHAGGQPPMLATAKDTYFHYLTEAGHRR